MKVVHFSDTHLGYREYHAYNKDSMNQREADTYRAFNEIIDYIVKTKPNLVIHAGDLFDSQRPTSRALYVAMEGFSKLAKEEIPVVIIAGNHSTPRDRSDSPILEILNYLPGIHSVCKGKYETIPIEECLVHAIPHMYSNEDLSEAIAKLNPDKKYKYNILVTHAAIKGIGNIASKEFKEQIIPKSYLSKKFAYIALGHYHKFIKIQDNAYYCGSPEKFSFNEELYNNGFIEIELDGFDLKHKLTSTRSMKTINIDCEGLESEDILESLEKQTHNIDDKIIRIIFDRIKKYVYFDLNQHKIKNIVSNVLHYEVSSNIIVENDDENRTVSTIGNVKNEYEAFVERQDLQKAEKKKILSIGIDYLDKAMMD